MDKQIPEPRYCSVRDGRFVDPCSVLAENVQNHTPGFSKTKGIAEWNLVNTETHKPSRRYFGVKTTAHPNGFLFNHCPFCGVKIDEPFKSDQSE